MVMTMWALIQGGEVLETTDIDPVGRFHSGLEWVPCGAEVGQRWLFVEGVFTAPEMGVDDLASSERIWRDSQLSSTEWLVMRHRDELDLGRPTTLTTESFTELLDYRQALRDWPLAATFPDANGRPVKPEWVNAQIQ